MHHFPSNELLPHILEPTLCGLQITCYNRQHRHNIHDVWGYGEGLCIIGNVLSIRPFLHNVFLLLHGISPAEQAILNYNNGGPASGDDIDYVNMLYSFFWVIPRDHSYTYRLFGTPCLFQLHISCSHSL